MATQRYISTSFWDDPWIVSLEPLEQFLYLYFLTNPLTNIAGVYQISIRRMVNDTKFQEVEIRRIITKFQEAGKAYYYNNEFLVLPNWPKHQRWENRKKIQSGIDACLKKLSQNLITFLKEIGYRYPMDNLSITYPYHTDNLSIPDTYDRNYSDIDIDIDPDIDTNAETAKKLSSHFIQLWQRNGDVFNFLARIQNPKDWEAFWNSCTFTEDDLNVRVGNFVTGVKNGAIEPRFVPASPDAFVLRGWLQRSVDPYKKQDKKISNDLVDDTSQYFREA
jgi:hypothetical protein